MCWFSRSRTSGAKHGPIEANSRRGPSFYLLVPELVNLSYASPSLTFRWVSLARDHNRLVHNQSKTPRI